MKRTSRPARIAFMILMGILAVVVFGGIVMLLWNNVLAEVVSVSTVNFWQALGILVLAKILFGGFGGGSHYKRRWKNRMSEKWNTMTPEEREKFKQEWDKRCSTERVDSRS